MENDINIMTAEEARKKINDLSDSKSLELKQHAKTEITKAVDKGLSQTNLSVPYTHTLKIKKWLESLGYKVDAGSDQRDGSWFQVIW